MKEEKKVKAPAALEIQRMIDAGAVNIPVKLVKRLMKEYNKDALLHFELLDKMDALISKYG